MPRIAIKIDPFIENSFTEPGLAVRGRIGTAAFVDASGIKTQTDEIFRGLSFQDYRVSARLEPAGVFGSDRLVDRFATDFVRVQFGNIEMVAQEIAGTATVLRFVRSPKDLPGSNAGNGNCHSWWQILRRFRWHDGNLHRSRPLSGNHG